MGVTCTFFWDGTEANLNRYFDNYGFYRKKNKRKDYWVKLDKQYKEHFLISKPISGWDDIELTALKRVFEKYFKNTIDALVFCELTETYTNRFGNEGHLIIATIFDELKNTFNFMVDKTYESIKQAEKKELAQILKSAQVYYPSNETRL